MTGVRKTAKALLHLVREHLLSEEPTGALLFQVEEFCDDYNDVRKILMSEDERPKTEQQGTLLEYARGYGFTREMILTEIRRKQELKESVNEKYKESVYEPKFFAG